MNTQRIIERSTSTDTFELHHIECLKAVEEARKAHRSAISTLLMEGGMFKELSFYSEGEQGTTFRGVNSDSKPVIIKCLKHPSVEAQFCPIEDLRSYVREAQISDLVQTSGVPRVHHVGRLKDGTVYFVRDEVVGVSLLEHIQQGRKFNEEEVRALISKICKILDKIHDYRGKRVIHSDIKPSNIIWGEFGEVSLIDFGSARSIQIGSTYRQSIDIKGSPGYMPPEQMVGAAGPYSDIYSLGVTAIEALAGYIPEDLANTALHRIPYKLPRSFKISEEFRLLLEKMVHSRAMNRYQSAIEVLNDLDAPSNLSRKDEVPSVWGPITTDHEKIRSHLEQLWRRGSAIGYGFLEGIVFSGCRNVFRNNYPTPRHKRQLLKLDEFSDRIASAFLCPQGGERVLQTETFLEILSTVLSEANFFYEAPRIKDFLTARSDGFAWFWHLYLKSEMLEHQATGSSYGRFGWYTREDSVRSPIEELEELVTCMSIRLDPIAAIKFRDTLRTHPKVIFRDRRASLMLLSSILKGGWKEIF